MEIPLKTPITLFVRVKGPRGERELEGILDTFATHMTIPHKDAIQLGYDIPIDPEIDIGQGRKASCVFTTLDVATITLQEIRIGDLAVENVEAIVYDLLPDLGVETILGISLLQNLKTTLDYERGVLRIEKIGPQKSPTATNFDPTS